MLFQDFLTWIKQEFGYPVPKDYLSFVQKGDFISTLRKNYVIDRESESVLEISEWFTYDNVTEIYKNCLNEKMIEKYHLPILDSCGCTIVLDCNIKNHSYGQVFSRTPVGYYDENLQDNVYLELDFVANSFFEIINNLKTTEELEEIGIF